MALIDLSTLDSFQVSGTGTPTVIDVPDPQFQRYSNNPVVKRDLGTDYLGTVQTTSLFYEDGWWYCFYDGWVGDDDRWGIHLKKTQTPNDPASWAHVTGPFEGGTILDCGVSLRASGVLMADGSPIGNAGSCYVFKFGARYYMYYNTSDRHVTEYTGFEKYEGRIAIADAVEGPYHHPTYYGYPATFPNGPYGNYNSDITIPLGIIEDEAPNCLASQIGCVWYDSSDSLYHAIFGAVNADNDFGYAQATCPNPVGPWTPDLVNVVYTHGGENWQMIYDSTRSLYYWFANDLIGGAAPVGWMNCATMFWGADPFNPAIEQRRRVLLAPGIGAWDSIIIGVPSNLAIKDGEAHLAYDGRSLAPTRNFTEPVLANGWDNVWPYDAQMHRDVGLASATWPFNWGHAIECTIAQTLTLEDEFTEGMLAVQVTAMLGQASGFMAGITDGVNTYAFEFGSSSPYLKFNKNGVVTTTTFNFNAEIKPIEFTFVRDGASFVAFYMGNRIANFTGPATAVQLTTKMDGYITQIEFAEAPLGIINPPVTFIGGYATGGKLAIPAYNEQSVAWKMVKVFAHNVSWKLFKAITKDTAWKLRKGLTKNTVWKLFKSTNRQATWKVKLGIAKQTTWKLFKNPSINTNWQVLVGSTVAVNTAWKIATGLSKIASWRVFKPVSKQTSWKLFKNLNKVSSWKLFKENTKDSAWKLFAELSESAEWKIYKEQTQDSAWVIFVAGLEAIDTSWKIQVGIEKASAWKLFASGNEDSEWKVFALSNLSASTSWKIFKTVSKDSNWKILSKEEAQSAWAVISTVIAVSPLETFTTKTHTMLFNTKTRTFVILAKTK